LSLKERSISREYLDGVSRNMVSRMVSRMAFGNLSASWRICFLETPMAPIR